MAGAALAIPKSESQGKPVLALYAGFEDKIRVILFAPLFTLAERMFNPALAQALERQSNNRLKVTLPQEEAKQFFSQRGFDFNGVREKCLDNAVNYDVAVAILDGPDADSGTCIELAYRKGGDKSKVVIGVRTDFRGGEHKGLNAMLGICDEIVYASSLEVKTPEELADKIIKAILRHWHK